MFLKSRISGLVCFPEFRLLAKSSTCSRIELSLAGMASTESVMLFTQNIMPLQVIKMLEEMIYMYKQFAVEETSQ